MRQSVIDPDREKEVFAYIMGITNSKKAKLIRINAALNHIHMLVKLPADICPSAFIADVKRASSIHIKKNKIFPKFWGWAREYSVETVSREGVPVVRAYIANQKEHHKVVTFDNEWLDMLDAEDRVKWDNRYFDT